MFFSENALLVRCNENARIGPDGKYYHRLSGSDEQNVHMEGIAFQVSAVLAMIINACEQKEFTQSHYFADRQGFRLMQADRGGLSLERFSFGDGKSQIAAPQE